MNPLEMLKQKRREEAAKEESKVVLQGIPMKSMVNKEDGTGEIPKASTPVATPAEKPSPSTPEIDEKRAALDRIREKRDQLREKLTSLSGSAKVPTVEVVDCLVVDGSKESPVEEALEVIEDDSSKDVAKELVDGTVPETSPEPVHEPASKVKRGSKSKASVLPKLPEPVETPKPAEPAPKSPDAEVQKTGKNPKVLVARRFFKSGEMLSETAEVDEIPVRQFEHPAIAHVGCAFGATVNLGNYESCKVDVHITLPCYVEEIEDAFIFSKNFAESKVGEIVKEIRSGN